MNGELSRIQTAEGFVSKNLNWKDGSTEKKYPYSFTVSDHLGNIRVVVDEQGTLLQKNEYTAFGVVQSTGPSKNKYLFNNKELQTGTNYLDYGARMYQSELGRWNVVDPLGEKTFNISPFTYSNNNPINMIDKDGLYAVSVHYRITYEAMIARGHSKERADLIAHYSSTYADHPSTAVRFADFMLHPFETNPHPYRNGIDYGPTVTSQDEKNSRWHSMMSDADADGGMTEYQSLMRGLKFGWDNIFESKGKNLGKLGQGIHALQDAFAHGGMKTDDHLGFNVSSVSQTLGKDMYGSTEGAERMTRSALIVVDLIQGKKVNLKDGDNLNVTGMSGKQLHQVMNGLLKQGFTGTLSNSY